MPGQPGHHSNEHFAVPELKSGHCAKGHCASGQLSPSGCGTLFDPGTECPLVPKSIASTRPGLSNWGRTFLTTDGEVKWKCHAVT